MIRLCTLFDSYYMDKGLVMIDSLHAVEKDFLLYVAAFDEKCKAILNSLEDENLVILSLDDLKKYEHRLNELEKTRKRGEFCWTCTPILCEYLLVELGIEDVTYIDADLFFYSSPKILLDDCKDSVGIIPHRFPQERYFQLLEKHSGVYCVEFNYFRNDTLGRKVLSDWKENCILECTSSESENGFGDQRYLSEWPGKYKSIYIFSNPGAGVASWNIKDYALEEDELKYRGRNVDLIFYHFSGLDYEKDGFVNSHIGDFDRTVSEYFYLPYLRLIEEKRNEIQKKYSLDLRKRSLQGNRSDGDEVRESFLLLTKERIRSGHILLALKECLDRMYVSRFSRRHYGTTADWFELAKVNEK